MARKLPPAGSSRTARSDQPLAWLSGELKTPPLSGEAHELRIDDVVRKKEWRIICCVGRLAIAVLEIFPKDTRATPDDVIRNCRRRLAEFRKVDES